MQCEAEFLNSVDAEMSRISYHHSKRRGHYLLDPEDLKQECLIASVNCVRSYGKKHGPEAMKILTRRAAFNACKEVLSASFAQKRNGNPEDLKGLPYGSHKNCHRRAMEARELLEKAEPKLKPESRIVLRWLRAGVGYRNCGDLNAGELAEFLDWKIAKVYACIIEIRNVLRSIQRD